MERKLYQDRSGKASRCIFDPFARRRIMDNTGYG
jgi:hypothetical protein